MEKSKNSKVIISLAVAVLLMAGAFIAPEIGALTPQMVSVIFVIVCAVFLWVTKPVPLAVSSLVILVMLPMLGLTKNLNDAFAGYSNSTNFFVIASFGLAIAVKKTTISGKLLQFMLRISKGKSKYVVLSYMVMTYVVSAFMSDIAAVMVGIAFARQQLALTDDGSENGKRFGKVLMLSLPFASAIGGTATPAGSSINVMALNLLGANVGVEVGFLQWCALALPVSVILLLVCWKLLTMFYPSDDMTAEQVSDFTARIAAENVSKVKSEKYVICVIIAIIAAWMAGTWVSALNTTTVAVFGLLLLILPGIGAFDWKEFQAGVPWEIFLMGGATIMLGNLARSSGLVQLLADSLQANMAGINAPEFIVVLGLLVTAILVVMPVGPATVSMLTMPVHALATALGINPLMSVVALGCFASNSCILPLNAVMLLSFSTGYWKISDLAKIGLINTAAWLIIASAWFPLVSQWVF